jgi:hypothetical protein
MHTVHLQKRPRLPGKGTSQAWQSGEALLFARCVHGVQPQVLLFLTGGDILSAVAVVALLSNVHSSLHIVLLGVRMLVATLQN